MTLCSCGLSRCPFLSHITPASHPTTMRGTGMIRIFPPGTAGWAKTRRLATSTDSLTDISVAATYKWTEIGSTNEYYCELLAGGDPDLAGLNASGKSWYGPPIALYMEGVLLTEGSAVGSLSAQEWIWGATGAGFDSVIVKLTGDADPDTVKQLVKTGVYKWTKIGATDEYYCELNAGGDPALVERTAVTINGSPASEGSAIGALAVDEWIWGDGGGGFDTLIVRLTGDLDPDTKADGWVSVEQSIRFPRTNITVAEVIQGK